MRPSANSNTPLQLRPRNKLFWNCWCNTYKATSLKAPLIIVFTKRAHMFLWRATHPSLRRKDLLLSLPPKTGRPLSGSPCNLMLTNAKFLPFQQSLIASRIILGIPLAKPPRLYSTSLKLSQKTYLPPKRISLKNKFSK